MNVTIVAAIEFEGVPVLVGDFLITEPRDAPSMRLHTRPDMPLPSLRRRVSDLRRKCIIINHRFIVAFTGDVACGRRIIKELVARFSGMKNGPTLEKIEKALHHFTFTLDRKDATIIGWTIPGRRPICFSFTAKLDEKVKSLKRAVRGSGSSTFEKYLQESRSNFAYTSSIRTASDKAALQAVAVIGRVLSEEMISGDHLAESFGGGAEVAIYNGRKFEFVPKIGFLFWNVALNEMHEISFMPSRMMAVYENRGAYALFATFTQAGMPTDLRNHVPTSVTASY